MDLSVGRRLVVNIYLVFSFKFHHVSHTIFRSSRPKVLFLEISQNSEENTCARVSSLVKLIDHAKDCDTVATVSTERFGTFWNESLLGIDGFFGPI